jgi:peptide/nickel transport system substrate-binding protein
MWWRTCRRRRRSGSPATARSSCCGSRISGCTCLSELLLPADRQSQGPPGDPGRARHGGDHGGGERRRLSLGHAYQFRGSVYYSDAGKELYNQRDKEKAKRLLQEAGYKGEKVILLTNRDYVQMYNASVVINEQLKAVGINSELLVLDWPAALDKSVKDTTGWNMFFSGWTSVVAQGGLQSLRFLADPFNVHKPKDNKSDPEFMAAWLGGLSSPKLEDRVAAFERAQKRAYEQAMAYPLGILPKVQGTRANVEGFTPFFITRGWNVSVR